MPERDTPESARELGPFLHRLRRRGHFVILLLEVFYLAGFAIEFFVFFLLPRYLSRVHDQLEMPGPGSNMFRSPSHD